MKKNTVKLFILAAMLGGSLSAHAQYKPARVTMKEADVKRLKVLSQELTAAYEARHAEAVRLAEINNWPLIIKKDDGSVSTLDRVVDGKPLYKGNYNVGSALTSRTNALQPNGSLGLNLTGEFPEGDVMTVGVWDGGYPLANHNDLTDRTIPSDNDPDLGIALHPTHVTGTVIGNGASAGNSKGMASKAVVKSYTWNNDAGEMAEFAIEYILSNHSYGLNSEGLDPSAPIRGTYTGDSRSVDLIMFDAPYYLPVFAAGNDNDISGMYDLMTDMSLAKNAIAVAAVKQVDSYVSSESVEITEFSSWGPSNDNRIKPDIATKGEDVYSCSDAGPSAHAYENGTSMASPGIMGSLTLIQQYYSILHPSQDDHRNFMRSATLRGLVAHSADEAGLAPGPDPIYGWGLMNSKRAAEILKAASTNSGAKIQELVLLPGAANTQTFQVIASGTEPLVATLAWTDPASSATAVGSSTVTQVNNLDIKITKGTNSYYPWRLMNDDNHLAINDGPNNVDNVEKVEIPNASGTYTITISHKKTTLVNPNGEPQQAFSLILTGITDIPAGLDDVNQKMFTVWPNPANSVLNISFGNGIEEGASATFYDIQGRLVRTAKLTNVDNAIDVQDLAKGLYVVSVTNGNKTEIEKVIIK